MVLCARIEREADRVERFGDHPDDPANRALPGDAQPLVAFLDRDLSASPVQCTLLGPIASVSRSCTTASPPRSVIAQRALGP